MIICSIGPPNTNFIPTPMYKMVIDVANSERDHATAVGAGSVYIMGY